MTNPKKHLLIPLSIAVFKLLFLFIIIITMPFQAGRQFRGDNDSNDMHIGQGMQRHM